MKKVILTLVLAFGMFAANAQVWIGGGLGGNIQKNYMKLSIAPEVGYAFNSHWQVALGAGYGFSQTKGVDLLGEPFTINTNELTLQPGIAWMATKHWTAAFRFGKIGYSHNFYMDDDKLPIDGFILNGDLAAPQIRIYYSF